MWTDRRDGLLREADVRIARAPRPGPGRRGWLVFLTAMSTAVVSFWLIFWPSDTKNWIDNTPPDASCTPAVNPHGRNVPRAGERSPGQNEDGFYLLEASDAVDPDPQITVVDAGSGATFGPFSSGTRIKYTQAPGAPPSIKTIGSGKGRAGAVDWHVTGVGDAQVSAVDGSGNESDTVSCLVPPPPQ